jgi:sporulation protein YlmC with PRC-barrel domain
MMSKLAVGAAVATALTSIAYAQTPAPLTPAPQTPSQLTTSPAQPAQAGTYYKQSVYDSSDNKIGEITDVVMGSDGKINGFIVAVGGFLGVGEKDVAVPFDAIRSSQRNGNIRLTINATKDQLEKAPAFKFDNAFAQATAPQTPAERIQAERTAAERTQAERTTIGVATPDHVQTLSTVPQNTTTIASYYKKNVYDRSDAKIGEITDALVDKDGKIDGFMMSVGGFLGLGEKNVAVPFDAVKVSERNGSWWLTMDSTKDQLQKAPGFKYDSNKSTWVPAA